MWVRFHDELTEGSKRGIPRAVRFVYMELSLKARKRRGWIPLASGMSDVDAVHDLLGGNRREIAQALKVLADGDDPMIRFEDTSDGRRLIVVNWEKWNKVDDSGDRVRRLRERRNDDVTRYTTVTKSDETRFLGPRNEDVTRYKSVSNDAVTPLELDQDQIPTADVDLDPSTKRARTREEAPPPSATATTTAPRWQDENLRDEDVERAFVAELRKHRVFATLDLHEVAQALTKRFQIRSMHTGMKLEWALAAIGECAADSAGAGLAPHVLTKRLRAYLDRARKPQPLEPQDNGESLSKRIPDGMPELPPEQPVEVMQANAAKALERFRELQATQQGPVRRPIARPAYPAQGDDPEASPRPRHVAATAVH